MINGNGGKCKSTANKYALSATDLPGEHLALMESGNTLIHSAGIINTQFLHDMDAVAMNRFMSNAEQGGNTLIIIVGNDTHPEVEGIKGWYAKFDHLPKELTDALAKLEEDLK